MLAKILVVDDEADLELLVSQKFRKKIRSDEYKFIFARSGGEALSKLEEEDIDIVLSDINMPGMDGLTLLDKINQLNPPIKTVMISAYGDIRNIRKAMNCGAFDFLTKPIDFQDLEITINKTLSHVQQLKENIRLRETQEKQLQESEKQACEQAKQLKQLLLELQNTQAQLIHKEKMSSLGQMVAGVAHEINNPIGFIYGNISYISDYLQDLITVISLYQQHYPNPKPELQTLLETTDINFLTEDVNKILASIKAGAERISKIVLSLRSFARLDEAELKPVNIHEGIDSTLLLLKHRLKHTIAQEIKIIKEYDILPLVECYPGELNQVFMNIISNAIDAIASRFANDAPEKAMVNQSGVATNKDGADKVAERDNYSEVAPTIWIRTKLLPSGCVTVQIIDNGLGMTEEVKKRLFDPFFTTKTIGQGTGLGLSISYQIVVEKHQGSLRYESESGQGTKFLIEIPICQSQSCISQRKFLNGIGDNNQVSGTTENKNQFILEAIKH